MQSLGKHFYHYKVFLLCFASLFFQQTVIGSAHYQEKNENSNGEQIDCQVDLKQHWLEFDYDNDIYIPYVKKQPTSFFSIFFSVTSDYKNKYLNIRTPERLSVFINSKLINVIEPNESYILHLSGDLFNNTDVIIYNLYSSEITDIEPFTCIGKLINNNSSQTSSNDLKDILRNVGNYKVFGVFILIFITLLLMVYTKLYRSISSYYFNINDIFTSSTRTDISLYSRFNDTSHHLLLFILSMVIAYLYIIIEQKSAFEGIGLIENMRFVDIPTWIFIYQWLTYVFYVYFLIIIKIYCAKVVSTVLGGNNTFKFYAFEYFRLSMYIYLFAFLVCMLYFFIHHEPIRADFHFIYYIAFVLALFRIVILYYKLYFNLDKNRLFTFSFICILDLIPYFVCIRFFIF